MPQQFRKTWTILSLLRRRRPVVCCLSRSYHAPAGLCLRWRHHQVDGVESSGG